MDELINKPYPKQQESIGKPDSPNLGSSFVSASNDDHLGVSTGMQHGGNLKQQWLTLRALLLGAVQNADALRGLRQSRQQAGTVPRSEETHLPDSQQTSNIKSLSTSAIPDAY